MSAGRTVAALSASIAVGGCVVGVLALGHAATTPATAPAATDRSPTSSAAPTPRPAFVPAVPTGPATPATPVPSAPGTSAGRPASASVAAGTSTAPAGPVAVPTTRAAPAVAAAPAVPAAPVHTVTPVPTTAPVAPRPAPVVHPAPAGQRLPLGYSTGTATRVITVTASSAASTTATLQAWTKVSGGWSRVGPAIGAHVGAAGIGQPSEFVSRTPAGSFTLTQAFGRLADPGTPLPYFATTPSDYWISDRGPLYNTHQRCGSCGYDDGTNERLYYETPYYNYAVVIDTPSGASAYPNGSAFFLHVTDGRPTAGCVAIPQSQLVTLMRWLAPSSHPRILIGVG